MNGYSQGSCARICHQNDFERLRPGMPGVPHDRKQKPDRQSPRPSVGHPSTAQVGSATVHLRHPTPYSTTAGGGENNCAGIRFSNLDGKKTVIAKLELVQNRNPVNLMWLAGMYIVVQGEFTQEKCLVQCLRKILFDFYSISEKMGHASFHVISCVIKSSMCCQWGSPTRTARSRYQKNETAKCPPKNDLLCKKNYLTYFSWPAHF